jgi:NAD(P)-dependent dehydrogenase (short-subunit alcohol dehydrogenase family)
MVAGRGERALGETVGEIAYGGGKARHVVTDVRDRASVAAAVERTIETFGSLDVVVAATGGGAIDAGCTLKAAAPRITSPGRMVVASGRDPAIVELVGVTARELAAGRITCNAVVPGTEPAPAAEPEDVAELVVFLCGSAAGAITGQTIAIGRDRVLSSD